MTPSESQWYDGCPAEGVLVVFSLEKLCMAISHDEKKRRQCNAYLMLSTSQQWAKGITMFLWELFPPLAWDVRCSLFMCPVIPLHL